MSEDQRLTARPGTLPVTPRAQPHEPHPAPGPDARQPATLCRAGGYAGIVTAVRKVVERNADFGS